MALLCPGTNWILPVGSDSASMILSSIPAPSLRYWTTSTPRSVSSSTAGQAVLGPRPAVKAAAASLAASPVDPAAMPAAILLLQSLETPLAVASWAETTPTPPSLRTVPRRKGKEASSQPRTHPAARDRHAPNAATLRSAGPNGILLASVLRHPFRNWLVSFKLRSSSPANGLAHGCFQASIIP